MYTRLFSLDDSQSFFLFGPRGVGKSKWIETAVTSPNKIDLLDARTARTLMNDPSQLETYILDKQAWVVIDEVQKVPELLDEVHRLTEKKRYKFILSGSNARKLKRSGANLLAGRALTRHMYPLVAAELGADFKLEKSLKTGHLPMAYLSANPDDYLQSYLQTYIREEILQEGIIRNAAGFSRFLEAASFSQGQYLNVSRVSAEAGVDRKIVESYFEIVEDLLLAERLPLFRKKAQRKTDFHPKFFFFDVGVYRALRPSGPEDEPEFIDGAAIETLLYQELRALNSYCGWGFKFYCWRLDRNVDVDMVLYGKNGIFAFEIKRARKIRGGELDGLSAFKKKFPNAYAIYLYGGHETRKIGDIQVVPYSNFFRDPPRIMGLR